MGGSPSLLVMGADLCCEGHVFESQQVYWIDIVDKLVMLFLKMIENKQNRPVMAN